VGLAPTEDQHLTRFTAHRYGVPGTAVRAGLMDPVSSFAWGPESHYRLTWAAYQRREERLSPDLDLSDPRT
jgi:hypothetical protein